MRFTGFYVLLQVCALAFGQLSILDSPQAIQLLRDFRSFFFKAFGSDSPQGPRYLSNAKAADKLQAPVPDNVPFPCDVKNGRSAQVPTSVHRLRPGDIDVIGVLGDSISAGAGILSTSVEQVIIENRGVAAVAGGQGTWREHLTVSNILKNYNPQLIGYSYGDSLTIHEGSQLNVAESGAMSADLPYMAEVLIKRIKRHPKVDMKNHWKLIVVNIGSNDFCTNVCVPDSPWILLEEHRRNLLKTLRLLRDNLPRTLVVLSSPPHLKSLVDTDPQGRNLLCYLTTMVECSCMFALKYRHLRPMYYEVQNKWFDLETEVARYPEFHRKDFDLVLSPCLRNAIVPKHPDGKVDPSFLAADCFHVSQKSNARLANCVWNNLLEPVNRKSTGWTPVFQRFLCPTEKMPYFITHANTPP